MRSSIIGVFAYNDDMLTRELVEANTLITHKDPKAVRGALVVAKAAALAASRQDVNPENCMRFFSEIIGADDDLAELTTKAATSAGLDENARTFCTELGLENGVTGYIYHTLPVVLQIWLRHQRNFEAAISEAVSCGGDTDTVAAILGGIVGATVGKGGIPETWQSQLRDWPRSMLWLEELASELAVVQSCCRTGETPVVSPVGALVRNALFMFWVIAHGFRRMLPPY